MVPVIVGGNDKLPVRAHQQGIPFRLYLVAEHGQVIQHGHLPGLHLPRIIRQDTFVSGELLRQSLVPPVIFLQLRQALAEPHAALVFGMVPVDAYALLLQFRLTLLPALLPAVEERPRKCQSCAPAEMPVPLREAARLYASVHKQVQPRLVLQVERTQLCRRVQAVQPVLFREKASPVKGQSGMKPDICLGNIRRIVDAVQQVQVHQVRVIRLLGRKA